jgi:hypothetical protein
MFMRCGPVLVNAVFYGFEVCDDVIIIGRNARGKETTRKTET